MDVLRCWWREGGRGKQDPSEPLDYGNLLNKQHWPTCAQEPQQGREAEGWDAHTRVLGASKQIPQVLCGAANAMGYCSWH